MSLNFSSRLLESLIVTGYKEFKSAKNLKRKMVMCLFILSLFISIIIFLIIKKLFLVSRPPSLKNKHVLITGGSSGIGKSTASEAAKLGAHVTIIARDKNKLEAAVEEIKKVAKSPAEQKIQHLSLDVTTGLDAVDKAVEIAEDYAGPIFLLVNCAGMAICGEFETATESDFRYMMNLNYFGTVFPTICVAKRMKKRKEGHIVLTGSQASLLGIYGMSAYCSSKFALRGFAESLHMELKPHNVSVTVCLPPDTNTPGFANEERSKPEITKLISETAGLFEPSEVSCQLLSDALNKIFFSSPGLEGLVLTTLCAGMSPVGSLIDLFLQISLMSLLRLVSVGYLLHFQRIIANYIKTSILKKDLGKLE